MEQPGLLFEDQPRLTRGCRKGLVNSSSLAPLKCLVTLRSLSSFSGWLGVNLRGLKDLLKVMQLGGSGAGTLTQVCWIHVQCDQGLARLAGGCPLQAVLLDVAGTGAGDVVLATKFLT